MIWHREPSIPNFDNLLLSGSNDELGRRSPTPLLTSNQSCSPLLQSQVLPKQPFPLFNLNQKAAKEEPICQDLRVTLQSCGFHPSPLLAANDPTQPASTTTNNPSTLREVLTNFKVQATLPARIAYLLHHLPPQQQQGMNSPDSQFCRSRQSRSSSSMWKQCSCLLTRV